MDKKLHPERRAEDQGDSGRPPSGWQERLDAASTPFDVVDVARDFMAMVTPEEVSLLPSECHPRKLVDAQDVAEYAVTLVKRSCADDRLSDRNLLRLATFFTRASLRLSEITAKEVLAEEYDGEWRPEHESRKAPCGPPSD